jgi:hypothetical protein
MHYGPSVADLQRRAEEARAAYYRRQQGGDAGAARGPRAAPHHHHEGEDPRGRARASADNHARAEWERAGFGRPFADNASQQLGQYRRALEAHRRRRVSYRFAAPLQLLLWGAVGYGVYLGGMWLTTPSPS